MFTITKTPILILSTPRTGSTVLGSYIKSLYGKDIPYIVEPDYSGQAELNCFYKYFNNFSKQFILKCHYINLDRYDTDIINYLMNESFKIRIRRKDFVKQFASLYIAISRNKLWHFRNTQELNLVDTIDIDITTIKQYIPYLKRANYELDRSLINFDLDLYYEDLPTIDNTGYYITPKPANYDELLATIKELAQDC